MSIQSSKKNYLTHDKEMLAIVVLRGCHGVTDSLEQRGFAVSSSHADSSDCYFCYFPSNRAAEAVF